MYRVTCDGFPLLDWRDNDLFLVAPKVRLEVNTAGEGSFTIYKQHPYFDKIARMKSVVEVTDETGVIFRGRVTGYSTEFDNGMDVDMEGALAYLNDSIVRPFSFPKDFKDDADYIAAKDSGNVVAFFLGWLIENHNAQVEDFQKLKLGHVTVTAPDNYFYRYAMVYDSTWDALRSRLTDSDLGGYICIRYEADGNYIDYLSEFTENNSQEIVYGQNLLDLTRETDADGIYSAMLPVGADGLTIAGLDDGELSDDIVKSGDTIYSRTAVAQFGWIYAPVMASTWDDVARAATLLEHAKKRLEDSRALTNLVEVTAVDLHLTDEQVESLRIYKNVMVHSAPHGLSATFPLTKLEIDLNDLGQTRITAGKRLALLTEANAQRVDKEIEALAKEISKTYMTNEETEEAIATKIGEELKSYSTSGQIEKLLESYSTHTQTANAITSTVSGKLKNYSTTGEVETMLESYSTYEQTAEAIRTTVSSELKHYSTTGEIETVLKSYSTREQTAEMISDAVEGYVDGSYVSSKITAALDGITLSATSADGTTTFTLTGAGIDIKTAELNITVDAANISGRLTIGQLPSDVATMDDIPDLSDLVSESDIADFIKASDLGKTGTVQIDGGRIAADSIISNSVHLGGLFTVYDAENSETPGGYLGYDKGFNSEYGIGIRSQKSSDCPQVVCTDQAARLSYGSQTQVVCEADALMLESAWVQFVAPEGAINFDSSGFYPASGAVTLGTSNYEWSDVHAAGTSMSELLARVEALEKA